MWCARACSVRYVSACTVSLIVAEAGGKVRFATTKSFVGSVNYKLDNGGFGSFERVDLVPLGLRPARSRPLRTRRRLHGCRIPRVAQVGPAGGSAHPHATVLHGGEGAPAVESRLRPPALERTLRTPETASIASYRGAFTNPRAARRSAHEPGWPTPTPELRIFQAVRTDSSGAERRCVACGTPEVRMDGVLGARLQGTSTTCGGLGGLSATDS